MFRLMNIFVICMIFSLVYSINFDNGKGWNSKSNVTSMMACFETTVKEECNIDQSNIDYSVPLSANEASQKISGGGELGFGIEGVEVNFETQNDFFKEDKNDEVSVFYVQSVDSTTYYNLNGFADAALSPMGKSVFGFDVNNAVMLCGDYLPIQVVKTASVSIRLTIKSKSFINNHDIGVKLKVGLKDIGPLTELKFGFNFSHITRNLSKDTKIIIKATQIGGNPLELNHILGDGANGLSCDFTNPSSCFESVQKYITETFPAQLSCENQNSFKVVSLDKVKLLPVEIVYPMAAQAAVNFRK